MGRAPARPVRACFVRTCYTVVVQEHGLPATPAQCNSKRTLSSQITLHSSHPTLHTSHVHFTLHTSSHLKSCKLFSPHLTSSQQVVFFNCLHLVPALINLSHLLEVLLNSSQLFCTPESSYCQREVSCTKNHWAQKTCAHRSLRHRCIYTEKPFQNTLYYQACTKHFPVLLCTTKLAQSTSQDYFVLQSLHKALLSTTLYYKACTKHVPVLLCTTKPAQSSSQHYFVLPSLRKVRPNTSLDYKACTKHFPVLLCTAKLAQKQTFTQRSFYTEKLSGT